jgi:hypothetical protein
MIPYQEEFNELEKHLQVTVTDFYKLIISYIIYQSKCEIEGNDLWLNRLWRALVHTRSVLFLTQQGF